MPVIVFGMPVLDGMEPDPEECSMCGRVTNDVVYVRLDVALVGVCDECVSALSTSMSKMKEVRAKHLAKYK